MSDEAKSDEKRYTKAQVAEAVEDALVDGCEILSARTVAENVVKRLDPPKRTCRCGRWEWDGDNHYWYNKQARYSHSVGDLHGGCYICSSCRCALLVEGKVSEPLLTLHEADHWYGEMDGPAAAWLRDRPLEPVPE